MTQTSQYSLEAAESLLERFLTAVPPEISRSGAVVLLYAGLGQMSCTFVLWFGSVACDLFCRWENPSSGNSSRGNDNVYELYC